MRKTYGMTLWQDDFYERPDHAKWYSSELFAVSPYGGGDSVAEANIRYIERVYPHLYNTAWTYLNCHGKAIGFNLRHLSNALRKDLQYVHEKYPCLDDEEESQVEIEWLNEAIDDWAAEEAASKLGLDEVSGRLKDAIASAVMENFGQYNHVEAAGMWIDMDSKQLLEKIEENYNARES